MPPPPPAAACVLLLLPSGTIQRRARREGGPWPAVQGLGAPVGSIIVGPAAFVKRAHRLRKMLGGGMRQVAVLAGAVSPLPLVCSLKPHSTKETPCMPYTDSSSGAGPWVAPGLVALRESPPLLAKDHSNAKAFARGAPPPAPCECLPCPARTRPSPEADARRQHAGSDAWLDVTAVGHDGGARRAAEIAKIEGVSVDVRAVDSNIVIWRLTAAAAPRPQVVKRLQEHGVLVCQRSPLPLPPARTRSPRLDIYAAAAPFCAAPL